MKKVILFINIFKLNLKFKISEYRGCYRDDSKRDINNQLNVRYQRSNSNTKEKCFDLCFRNYFRYAGLQDGYNIYKFCDQC